MLKKVHRKIELSQIESIEKALKSEAVKIESARARPVAASQTPSDRP